MNRLLPKKLIYVIFLTAFSILLYSSFITFQQVQHLLIANETVIKTHQVIAKLNEVTLKIIDGGRLEQSYIESNNERYLLASQISLQTAIKDISDIKQLTQNDRKQQIKLNDFEKLAQTAVVSLQNVLKVNQIAGKDNAIQLLISQKEQAKMNQLKDMADDMIKEEYRLLQERNANLYIDSHQSNVIIIAGGITSSILLLITFIILTYQERKYSEEQDRINKELADKQRLINETARLKSEFLANMSHELLTPLNAIIGFSELLQDKLAGPITDEQSDYLQEILLSSRHLQELINDVLDLTRIESGRIDLAPENFSVSSLVHEVVDILRPLAAKKKIFISTLIDDNLTTVHIDPVRFKQVLYNYLSNAIHFTPELGTVKIHVRPESEKSFIIEVEDNGIGIKPEDVEKLFVEFQQVDSRDIRKFQGTGLGLALTKRIVEAQGGRVGVNSTPDKGSIFYAVLPCEQETSQNVE